MINQQALLGVGAKLVWYVNDHLTLNAPFLNKRIVGGGFVNVGNNYSIRAWRAVLTYLLSDYRFLYD